MNRRFVLVAVVLIGAAAVTAAAAGWVESAYARVPDCEAPGPGWVSQPVSAWSAMVLVAAAIWIAMTARRPAAHIVALAAAASGSAAFVFHAAPGEATARLDALGVALVTGTLAVSVFTDRTAPGAGLCAVLAGIWLTAPAALEPLALLLGLTAAIGAFITRADRHYLAISAGAMAAGGLLWALGRSGSAWCAARSVLQPHALWHALAAAAVGFGVAALRYRNASRDRLYSVG